VPTPPKYSHKMPSKTGKSEYYLKYGSTRGHSVPEKKLLFDQSAGNVKMHHSNFAGYESIYHVHFGLLKQDFAKKASEYNGKAEKAKYKKSDAPTFN